ncbi:MAG: histidine phosphatase family protein [Gammaproteobacteria bacterium]
MQKRITLLRHAKSSWKDASVADRDRPLNRRGSKSAPDMGKRLADRGVRPSLLLTSPAKRARETARLIARELNYPLEFIQSESELYLATPETILQVVARQDDGFNDVMLFGHNPGITELANQLGDRNIDNVPTCGVVGIELDVQEWAEIVAADGKTVFFDYPKSRPQ